MQTYQVDVSLSTQEDGLWRAEVPALPGCFMDEETVEEALQDIQEGIKLFIASYQKHEGQLPEGVEVIPPNAPQTLVLAVSAP